MENRKVPVRLSFLGDRTYIDISTLHSACYSALGLDHRKDVFGRAVTKIPRAVSRHGHLEIGKSRGASCILEFEIESKGRFQYSFVESGDVILDRREEERFNLSEYVRIEDNIATFVKPINDFRSYNFMVLGKALIVVNTPKIPRVVRSEFFSTVDMADYVKTQTTYRSLPGGFGLLRTRLGDRPVLDVLVKLI